MTKSSTPPSVRKMRLSGPICACKMAHAATLETWSSPKGIPRLGGKGLTWGRSGALYVDFRIEAASPAIFAVTGSPNGPNNKRCKSEDLRASHLAPTLSRAAEYYFAFWCAWVRLRRTKACKMSNTSVRYLLKSA